MWIGDKYSGRRMIGKTHPPVPRDAIFVFGSNLAGRHGRGAAATAKKLYGAVYGCGIGLRGRSYAIPTKGWELETLPLTEIAIYVQDFIRYAWNHPSQKFYVTRIGCGLAGYKDTQIAPLFEDALVLPNVDLPTGWRKLISESGVGQAPESITQSSHQSC